MVAFVKRLVRNCAPRIIEAVWQLDFADVQFEVECMLTGRGSGIRE